MFRVVVFDIIFLFMLSACGVNDSVYSKGLRLDSPNKKFVVYYYSVSQGGGVGSSKDVISIMKYGEKFTISNEPFFESSMLEKVCLKWGSDSKLIVYLPDIIRLGGLRKEDINPNIDIHTYKKNNSIDSKINITYYKIPNSRFTNLCPGLWGSVGGFDDNWNEHIKNSRD